MNMFAAEISSQRKKALLDAWPLCLVFAAACAVRLVALAHVEIINPDGILYIYQAKAIAGGQWHLLNQCQLTFVSLYSCLIALLQLFVPSWTLSAQLVSLGAGMGMLFVLYPLLRLFFNPVVSRLTTLLLAFTPVLVRYSVDAMRDATAWFFFTAAIWTILLHGRHEAGSARSQLLLTAGSCLVFLAVWSRVEALVLLPATCLFIAAGRGERKATRLLAFLLPWLGVAVAGWIVMSAYGYDLLALIRLDEAAKKIFDPAVSYQVVRTELKALASGQSSFLIRNFLENAYHGMWVLAGGVVFTHAMEAFFYPYVPLYLLGAAGIWQHVRQRREYLFMAIVFFLSLGLLFVHVVQFWIMTYRFVAILMVPCAVLAGLGLQRACYGLSRLFRWQEKQVVALLAVCIVAVALPKNVQPIESDKAVYVHIGDRISQLAGNGRQVVGVGGKFSVAHNWIVFYANATKKEPVCYYSFVVEPASLADLITNLKDKGFPYFFWEESVWKKASFGQEKSAFADAFEELGRWHHIDTGEMVLFRLKG